MPDDFDLAKTENNADTTDQHWSELKALFDSAISLAPPQRSEFIDEKCGTNERLRKELESLLLAYEESGSFLEEPIEAMKLLVEEDQHTPKEDLTPGTRIGAYQIERELGRGGMGSVYLARRADSEYVKRVAIKVVRKGRESEFAIRRFRHERQILARLEHPFVARLIDGGTTEAGLPYFVMEYVEGQPLLQYCEAHSLNSRERVELFVKICSAVQYAHQRNVLHRDLKPANILVQEDGTPKLLDFGIAKVLISDSSGVTNVATVAGIRMLTPAYASPEQMRGDPVTVRSDEYSLGVILYELVCGERPGLGTFGMNPDREHAHDAHLSVPLRAIVLKAIRWNPDERYAKVEEFTADLNRYLDGTPPKADTPMAFDRDAAGSEISIAILPFRTPDTEEGENAFLASGITDALITKLSRVECLSVRPTSAVLRYAKRNDTARIAKELRVKYLLEGSVHKVANTVRVSIQLVYAECGVAVWASQLDENSTDLLKIEDLIAEQVAFALVPQLKGEEREKIARSGTESGRAHEAYLRGRWHLSRSAGDPEELAKSLLCFKTAISEDPHYARAHAGVADYYVRLGLWGGVPPAESFAAALEAAKTAVQLDPALGEAHASLGFAEWAYNRDYAAAEKHFNLAIIRDPNYGSAHHWSGLLNSARDQPDIAIANLERARKVDPNSPMIAAALGFVYYNARQFDPATRFLLEASRELRHSGVLQYMLSWCYLQLGDTQRGLETARLAVELTNRNASSLATLAFAEMAAGNRSAALALRDELEDLARKQYVSAYDRATAFLALGDTRRAVDLLQQAFEDRDWWVCWVGVEPRWDRLRGDSRFDTLVNQIQPASNLEAELIGPYTRKRLLQRAVPAVALLALFLIFLWRSGQHRIPFENVKLTQLTSNGIADLAVISSDGKYVAYTAMEGGDTGLFLRDLQANRTTELLSHLQGTISGLSFFRNSREISFMQQHPDQAADLHLFVVPVAGGTPRRVLGTFSGPVSLSPDGRQAVTLESHRLEGSDQLWLIDVGTGRRRMLNSFRYPERYSWACRPAWSPDGKSIAFAGEGTDDKGFVVRIYVLSIKDGSRRLVHTPRWQWVEHIAWTADQNAMAVVGQEHESSFQQIWLISYPSGQTRRIVGDLDNYIGVSLSDRGDALASVRARTLSNIYVTKPNQLGSYEQLTPGSGRYFDLTWTPDGKILYASDATGSADIWLMNADGSNARQITNGNGRNYAPASSPDGRVIAFHSNRTSNWRIWAVNADGSGPRELSESLKDGNWPQFTPDGKSIVFHQSDVKGVFTIWKVPTAGGTPVQLTNVLTMHPAVSPKDGFIAAWYSESADDPHWKIGLFQPEGGEPVRVFPVTRFSRPDTPLRWTPSGDAITFLDYANGCSNLWLQPVTGGPPHPITSFSSGDIYSFDWSRDGRLVYSRGLTTADVVLMRDAGAPGSSNP